MANTRFKVELVAEGKDIRLRLWSVNKTPQAQFESTSITQKNFMNKIVELNAFKNKDHQIEQYSSLMKKRDYIGDIVFSNSPASYPTIQALLEDLLKESLIIAQDAQKVREEVILKSSKQNNKNYL